VARHQRRKEKGGCKEGGRRSPLYITYSPVFTSPNPATSISVTLPSPGFPVLAAAVIVLIWKSSIPVVARASE
jgi:hypothetical protein